MSNKYLVLAIIIGSLSGLIVGCEKERREEVKKTVAKITEPVHASTQMDIVVPEGSESCRVEVVPGVNRNPIACSICYGSSGTSISCKETE